MGDSIYKIKQNWLRSNPLTFQQLLNIPFLSELNLNLLSYSPNPWCLNCSQSLYPSRFLFSEKSNLVLSIVHKTSILVLHFTLHTLPLSLGKHRMKRMSTYPIYNCLCSLYVFSQVNGYFISKCFNYSIFSFWANFRCVSKAQADFWVLPSEGLMKVAQTLAIRHLS